MQPSIEPISSSSALVNTFRVFKLVYGLAAVEPIVIAGPDCSEIDGDFCPRISEKYCRRLISASRPVS